MSETPLPLPPSSNDTDSPAPRSTADHRFRQIDVGRNAIQATQLPQLGFDQTATPSAGAAFWFMVAMLMVVILLGSFVAGRELGLFGAADQVSRVVAQTGPPAPPVICDDVEQQDQTRLERGYTLMTRTREGRQLYDQLIEHDVCTGVTHLEYAGAYAQANPSLHGWSDSVIMVDQEMLRAIAPDILAATLVHEAMHLDRAISGEQCGMTHSCTMLDNGIQVEEEVAAHAAEARWWLEIYGRQGRRVASGGGYSMDNLVFAYQRGSDDFRAHVIEIRSDPRDGKI